MRFLILVLALAVPSLTLAEDASEGDVRSADEIPDDMPPPPDDAPPALPKRSKNKTATKLSLRRAREMAFSSRSWIKVRLGRWVSGSRVARLRM